MTPTTFFTTRCRSALSRIDRDLSLSLPRTGHPASRSIVGSTLTPRPELMNRNMMETVVRCCLALALVAGVSAFAQTAAPVYDLLLHGGHVLDDKNHIDALMDVAIKDGK